MIKTNYHSHSHYCDGKFAPEEHVLAAIEKGFSAFGFSSHGPMPYDTHWNMKLERLPAYIAELRLLQTKYADQIELYIGIEADFAPGVLGPNSGLLAEAELDYTVGSIHLVDTFEDGTYWEIDAPHQMFLKGLHDIFHGDVQQAVCRYFELTRDMLKNDPPTILGHMDKIKVQNEEGRLFTEEDSWYKDAVMQTLQTISDSSVIVEVNTRGIYKKLCTEPYPSYWILEELYKRNIPITLNSDSHTPSDLDKGYSEVLPRLKEIGFDKLKVLYKGEWQDWGMGE